MKKYQVLCLFVVLSLLVPPLVGFAAYNDFTTDGSFTISFSGTDDETVTMDSGAALESLVINALSLDLTLAVGSTTTIRSPKKRVFAVSGFAGETTFTCDSAESTLVIQSLAASHSGTVTPLLEGDCAHQTPSSAGGGGGASTPTPAPTVVTPTNPSITINSGATITRVRAVTLALGATNASEVMVSESSNFTSGSWMAYATSTSFTLSEGLGHKTVYVKFKSSTGGVSTVASDTIQLVADLPAVAAQPVTPATGGKVSVSDNSATVDFPANAVSANTTVSITPTTNYTAPATTQGVAGSKAFEFKAEASGVEVKNFSKNITLTFKYSNTDISGLKESTLKIHYWDETNSKWVLVGGIVDAANNTVTVNVNHFTLYTVIGEKETGVGDLIKLECTASNKSICSAVYFLAKNGKRYVFPNDKIFFSWYNDFSTVKIVTPEQMASYTIGGNVTYRPGVRMVKITSDPKVYAVEKGGKLRWVKTEAAAVAIYGSNWNKMIDDLSDAFFVNYTMGNEIATANDYNKNTATNAASDINTDKSL